MVSPSFSALLELTSHCVLTVSRFPSTISFLADCMPNTYACNAVNHPNYRHDFFLAKANKNEYIEWAWESKQRIFERAPDNARELLAKSLLATAKRDAILYLMNSISRMRYQVSKGVMFQETVYLIKRMQAQAFRDAGYPEDALLDYPFVVQYADFAGITLKTAADDILYRAKLDDEILANTEILRLKHFNAVRNAQTPEELPGLLQEYLKDRTNALT